MKRSLFIQLILLVVPYLAFGQLEAKMAKQDVVPGAIYRGGEKIDGYIKMTGTTWTADKTFSAPWQFQGPIRFIPKDLFETSEKIKGKMYEYCKPGDIDAYEYGGNYYESVKYADMSAVGTNMLPQKMFMLRVLEDKVSLYQFFNSPPTVITGEKSVEEYFTECAEPQWVYRVGPDGKLKLVSDMNIEKELADCPMVAEKQSNGEYKVLGKEGQNSGGNKFVNNTLFRVEVRLMAIEDYNTNCGK